MLGNCLLFPVLVLVKLQGWSDCGEAVSSLGGRRGPLFLSVLDAEGWQEGLRELWEEWRGV